MYGYLGLSRLVSGLKKSLLFFTLIFLVQEDGAHAASVRERVSSPQIQSRLYFRSDTYMNKSAFQNTEAGDQIQIEGRILTSKLNEGLGYKVNVGGGSALNQYRDSYFIAPDVYVRYAKTHHRFYLGRKRHKWSEIDQNWDLGLVEPLFEWDRLNPEKQGLTGLFYVSGNSNFSMTFWYSPLFIPTQGPAFRTENGTIESTNPWFSEPYNTISIIERDTQAKYTLNIPNVNDIILQNSFGVQLSSGKSNRGFWTRASFLHKPMNTLALPFEDDGFIQLGENIANFEVFPTVLFHQVATLDFGYSFKRLKLSLSGLFDRVLDDELPSELVIPEFKNLGLISPSIKYYFSKFSHLRVSYLHQINGEVTPKLPPDTPDSVSSTISASDGFFDPRVNFQRAIEISSQMRFWQRRSQKMNGLFRAIYDWAQEGTILSSQINYYPGKSWKMSLAFDLIGTQADKTNRQGLINEFRENDRISGGVSFVF